MAVRPRESARSGGIDLFYLNRPFAFGSRSGRDHAAAVGDFIHRFAPFPR
jgi:hypothetical protein